MEVRKRRSRQHQKLLDAIKLKPDYRVCPDCQQKRNVNLAPRCPVCGSRIVL